MQHTGAYEYHNNAIGVKLSFLLSDVDRCTDNSLAVLSYAAYKQRVHRMPHLKLRAGLGPGNEVLLAWDKLPLAWQTACIARFGNPEQVSNPLDKFYRPDAAARAFYDKFQFEENDEYLKPVQKQRYTINASVLNAMRDLMAYRRTSRKSRGGKLAGLWDTIAADALLFNDVLKQKHNCQHTLPANSRSLKRRFDAYLQHGYRALVDGRNNNANAQVVTPQMIKLWKDIYAGQRGYKPTYAEVSVVYNQFLAGQTEIINNETGEVYNPHEAHFKPAAEGSVYAYQELWENRAATHALRSADRQRYMGLYIPYHKLKQPQFAGSIISVDDRQPPFEYAPGKRMWFYNAIDLGSEAFTCWVYGDSKEGIILNFYRQLLRNYAAWGLPLPYELEAELSLNASFKNTFLAPGALFTAVRIEANRARAKRIEAYYRPLRYQLEKKRQAWLARPFALAENNQATAAKKEYISAGAIVEGCLRDIETWNNTLHSNQELHPGLTRWQVFTQKQHPQLAGAATNWPGILPHLGYRQQSSMRAGRIMLQGQARMVGFEGKAALGERLINVMRKIEGQPVTVFWLDDAQGNVLKALVYDAAEVLVCELLGDFAYHRATLERGPADEDNRQVVSAYTATVQSFIRRNAASVDRVTVIQKPGNSTTNALLQPFRISGISSSYTPAATPARTLPQPVYDGFDEDDTDALAACTYSASTASRFNS